MESSGPTRCIPCRIVLGSVVKARQPAALPAVPWLRVGAVHLL